MTNCNGGSHRLVTHSNDDQEKKKKDKRIENPSVGGRETIVCDGQIAASLNPTISNEQNHSG